MSDLSPSDRAALADLAARYARAVDDRDFEQLREVFLDGAELDTGRTVRHGVDEVIDAMQGLHRYAATMHVLGQQTLQIHGDAVTGLTYCTAHHLSDDGDRRTDTVMHIRYHDRFVRTGDGWRISHRRLEVPWTDEQPVG